MNRAIARGLLQGYQEYEATLSTVRGRILFAEQLRRRYDRCFPIDVRFDEFTEDILENRLLRAAVVTLQRMQLRSHATRARLMRLHHTFQGISAVEFEPWRLPHVVANRLTEHYQPALALATLILNSSMISLIHGQTRCACFLVDMNQIFEDFVVVALREALGLSARNFPQGDRDPLPRRLYLDADRRVPLKPDLSWWDGGECMFVGDVKYKEIHRGVTNADLFQLLAYTNALALPTGMLIYAGATTVSDSYQIVQGEKRLRVESLDLTSPPTSIRQRAQEIAREIQNIRRKAPAAA